VRLARYNTVSGQLLASTLTTITQVLARYNGIQPQVSAEWMITPGLPDMLTLEIDPSHVLTKVSRSVQHLAYPGEPDLGVTAMKVDMSGAFAWGKPVTATLTTTVRNTGDLTSSLGLLTLNTRDANGTAYLPWNAPLPALPPDASFDVPGTLMVPSPGLYIVTAIVQSVGPDFNRNNNTATLDILAAAHQLYLPLVFRAGR
jgi:hypothetical protein